MPEIFSTPFGNFELSRYPLRKRELLRAWDAADEYVLNHLNEQHLPQVGQRMLVVNDQFGALSVALHQFSPHLLSDSYIATLACTENNSHNQQPKTLQFNSVEPLEGLYDLVVIKVQKSLSQLEDLLYKLRPHLHKDSVIVGCAMAKMIHTSTLDLFTKLIGDTRTSLAVKKARLIFATFNPALDVGASPYPIHYQLESHGIDITNHASVFSRNKLDIGSRFFIEHLPSDERYRTIVDLGCGNGVIGLIAAIKNPAAKVDFYDESFMAVESAKCNMQAHFDGQSNATFNISDCLDGVAANSADLILNNPPFHQQNTIGDYIAKKMFRQSLSVLRPGGELWVIGNRHLGYQSVLKKLFGNVRQVAANKKFVILCASKTR
ncbi:MAG: methyltransferase [Pseudomonadales bacterium]